MQQSTTINRRIVLNTRPHGAPSTEDFRMESAALPKPAVGQVLLRTLYGVARRNVPTRRLQGR